MKQVTLKAIAEAVDNNFYDLFHDLHEEYETMSGDIAPEDAHELDMIQVQLTKLIVKQLKYNIPRWRQEHPLADIDKEYYEILLKDGFEDISWHNDTMPCFQKELNDREILKLWIDYKDPKLSEFTSGYSRFVLQLITITTPGDEEENDLVSTNEFEVILDKFTEMNIIKVIKTKDLKHGYYMFGNKGALWGNKAHIARSLESTTLCGKPMLSTNWCGIEKVDEVGCPTCLKLYENEN